MGTLSTAPLSTMSVKDETNLITSTSSPPRFPVEMQLGRRDYHRDCQTPLGLMLEVNMWSVFFHRSWWHCDNFNGENWLQGVASIISRFWSVFDLIARQMIRSIGSCLRSATKQMTRFLTQRQFSDKPGIGARYIDFKQVLQTRWRCSKAKFVTFLSLGDCLIYTFIVRQQFG